MDTQGLLLGVVVHAANIQDADSLWDLLKRVKPLYSWLRVVFADSIYNRLTALLACFLFGLTLIIVRRAAGTTGFVVQPRRWVVERSLGWLGRWRRLSKDYEELPEVSEAMVTLAMIRLMLHRLVHPNRKGSVRARANKYRLSWDEPIQGHAACKMASTVTVLRRWRSLRQSAGTYWLWRE